LVKKTKWRLSSQRSPFLLRVGGFGQEGVGGGVGGAERPTVSGEKKEEKERGEVGGSGGFH